MMFFWIFVFAIILWAFLYVGMGNGELPFPKQKDRPIDLLKRRLANGEITEEEYEEKKEILEEDER